MKRLLLSFIISGIILTLVACGNTTSHASLIPAPSVNHTIYVSTNYHFRFEYPANWHILPEQNGAIVLVMMSLDKAIPNAVAFEVDSSANPQNLDSFAYWKQNQPSYGIESPLKNVKLQSGVSVFAANGQGQTRYTVYTTTHAGFASQLVFSSQDISYLSTTLTAVNSFTWL